MLITLLNKKLKKIREKTDIAKLENRNLFHAAQILKLNYNNSSTQTQKFYINVLEYPKINKF